MFTRNIECQIGTSDYYLLTTTLIVSPEMEHIPPRTMWLCQKAEWGDLRDALGGTNWKNINKTNDPEGSCKKITRNKQEGYGKTVSTDARVDPSYGSQTGTISRLT